MDSLTHALLGLGIGALRKTDAEPGRRLSATDRAVLLGAVLAAELPDLDYLWPARDAVLHALKAHRGLSHSLLTAPLIALVATAIAKLCFRGARLGAVYPYALGSVVFAHLCADAWTGWGTRLLLPFSDARITWDWALVLDPLLTAPLVIGAAGAWIFRRRNFRKPLLIGLGACAVYLCGRVVLQDLAASRVAARYPGAESVRVFPSWFGLSRFRFVAMLEDTFAVGQVSAVGEIEEQGRHARGDERKLSHEARISPTVREALSWARFPVIREDANPSGTRRVRIGDLRYHLNGEPTLEFVIDLDEHGRVAAADLWRGGSARALLDRWRGP